MLSGLMGASFLIAALRLWAGKFVAYYLYAVLIDKDGS